MKRNRKDSKFDTVMHVVIAILAAIIVTGVMIGIEYGRYLFFASDDMDFSTFLWIDTMRR